MLYLYALAVLLVFEIISAPLEAAWDKFATRKLTEKQKEHRKARIDAREDITVAAVGVGVLTGASGLLVVHTQLTLDGLIRVAATGFFGLIFLGTIAFWRDFFKNQLKELRKQLESIASEYETSQRPHQEG